jgi:hypothetical protein
MPSKETSTSRKRMREYRARMREKGLRPVQMWAYDTSAPGFREEIEKELEIIRNSAEEEEILDWIEQVYDWPKD